MDIKKILIFGGIGLFVIAGGGGGAFYFLNKPHSEQEEETPDEQNAPEKPAAAEAPKTPPPAPVSTSNYAADSASIEETVPVTQTHIINMPGSKGGFLKCQISILVRDLELGKKMNSDEPNSENVEAKSIVLNALSSMTEEDISDNEAKQVLRENITERLNERIRPLPSTDKKAPPRPARPFKDVLITEWAVQR